MARVNAQQFAEKWKRRMKGATEDIRNGVNNVTVAPGQMAAKQSALMLAKLTEALTTGRWEKAVSAVSLEDWKDSMVRKGLQRIAAGVDQAEASVMQAAQELLANVDASVSVVNQTPRGDLETNLTRANTFAREMHKRSKKNR